MNYKNFEFWNKEKLWKLRNEICFGSMFYNNYRNSFDIPEKICFYFFDGFIDCCTIIENEKANGLKKHADICNKYDNADELWNYFCGLEYPFKNEKED